MKNNIQQFFPVYSRPPCKFLEYFKENFDDGCGHKAVLTIAKFLDKNKKESEMVAFVKWL